MTQAFYAKRRTTTRTTVSSFIPVVPAGVDQNTNISSLFHFFLKASVELRFSFMHYITIFFPEKRDVPRDQHSRLKK